ncbi:MAG: peptidase, partial [Firmicutes bacterium]|nr:peptidase [Bacillota bacterium]
MDERIDAHFRAQRQRHLAELVEFLRIPSCSALPEHRQDIGAAAAWVAGQLTAAGIETVRVLETAGNPVVYGEWLAAAGKPTVLIYGHYDVQPPDPLDKWETPPFEPAFRENRIYARGVSDDKGPLFQAIKAIEALLLLDGRLPLNVKFLFEGEEEVGSPNLRPFIEAHAKLLACDLVVSADGAMWRPNEPSLTVGSKGLTGLEIHVNTARTDLHSGRHGGGVPNALHVLAGIVAGLHDEHGRVAVAGFYENVRDLTPEEHQYFAGLPFDEEAYRQSLDLTALVGEAGYSTLERQWARPTLDVNGMWGGFQGAGSKTVIPCDAYAKITCRLVPNQTPDEILLTLENHILSHVPAG